MKSTLFAVLALTSLNVSATQKVCRGVPGTEFGYEVLHLKLNEKTLSIRSQDTGFEGDYPANGDAGVLENGNSFLAYEDDVDGYHYYIKVDRALLKAETAGQIQIHSIHEGEGDDVFNCADN